jgi:hypothetical protein
MEEVLPKKQCGGIMTELPYGLVRYYLARKLPKAEVMVASDLDISLPDFACRTLPSCCKKKKNEIVFTCGNKT